MKSWAAFLFVLALLAGAALRLPDLGNRPMHNDEGVNGIKFGALWERGEYRYDPHEYHGPTLHYLTAALGRTTGAPELERWSEARIRLLTALAGLGLILLVPFLRDELGRVGVVAAALFTAVSPVMVFYSRYWIHEMLLVLFTFLAIIAVSQWLRKPGWCYAVVAGLAVGLMQATKETFVLALAAAVAGGVVNWLWKRSSSPARSVFQLSRQQLLLAFGAWLVVWGLFFTSFFQNAQGLLDSMRTYEPWLKNAGGDSTHANPWWFFAQRLFWFHPEGGPLSTESLLLLLAVVGGVSGFVGNRDFGGRADFVRWLAVYTVSLATIYSVIPYKTPWCVLGFHHGVILLAGVGVAVLWRTCRSIPFRGVLAGVLAIGTFHLGWQAWRGSFSLSAESSNPWVYSQTSPDVLTLVAKVDAVAAAGDGQGTLIKVIGAEDDYWPLPWYLRKYPNVGWWNQGNQQADAPIVIASAALELGLESGGTHIMVSYYQLRPQVFLELYVERRLWERYLAARSKASAD